MPRFCDSNIETDAIIGKGIDLDDLFDKRIVVEKIKIQPTKFPGKNASGMRMQMQVIPDAKFSTMNRMKKVTSLSRVKMDCVSERGVQSSPVRTI